MGTGRADASTTIYINPRSIKTFLLADAFLTPAENKLRGVSVKIKWYSVITQSLLLNSTIPDTFNISLLPVFTAFANPNKTETLFLSVTNVVFKMQ